MTQDWEAWRTFASVAKAPLEARGNDDAADLLALFFRGLGQLGDYPQWACCINYIPCLEDYFYVCVCLFSGSEEGTTGVKQHAIPGPSPSSSWTKHVAVWDSRLLQLPRPGHAEEETASYSQDGVSLSCVVKKQWWGAGIAQLVVLGLAVHSVAGSILLWGHFPVEGIFPLELTWVQTPVPQKLFRMRV